MPTTQTTIAMDLIRLTQMRLDENGEIKQELEYNYPGISTGAFAFVTIKSASKLQKRVFSGPTLLRSVGSSIHAEDNLYNYLDEQVDKLHFTNVPIKVIFFCTKSPCKKCCDKMLLEINERYNKLTRHIYPFYFSFVFRDYYFDDGRGGTPPDGIWRSIDDARKEYGWIERESRHILANRPYLHGFAKDWKLPENVVTIRDYGEVWSRGRKFGVDLTDQLYT